MNLFVKHILKIVVVLIISAYALDFGFTYVYKNSVPQNKVQYINSLKNQNFDYIFIGSSRVRNFIIPEIIEQKTNKKALNLGIHFLKLKDIACITKLLKEYNITYHKIFIQVDYSFNGVEDHSTFYSSELLPFCNSSSELIDSYLNNTIKNYFLYKSIPFIKYSNAEHLVGFRKIFSQLKGGCSVFDKNKGYFPMYGVSTKVSDTIPKFLIKSNKYFNEIKQFAKLENDKFIFFSSPVSSDTKNLNYFDKLKTQIPEINNFHNSINDNKYFSDNMHVNHDGAVVFTNILIEKLKL